MEYWKDILAPTVRYKFYGGDVIKSAMACEEVQGAIQDIRHELAEDTRRSESFFVAVDRSPGVGGRCARVTASLGVPWCTSRTTHRKWYRNALRPDFVANQDQASQHASFCQGHEC